MECPSNESLTQSDVRILCIVTPSDSLKAHSHQEKAEANANIFFEFLSFFLNLFQFHQMSMALFSS